MSIFRLGSALIASLRCNEPDPRPVAMTFKGTNHGYGSVVLQGQSRARENGKQWQWTSVCRGVVDQGSAALAVGLSGGSCNGGTGSVSLGSAAVKIRAVEAAQA